MENFVFHNPVKIVFGRGTIARLPELLPKGARVMMTWGRGSIRKNGVYDQVKAALKGLKPVEFSGIEANPQYSTLMKAVKLARSRRITFLLAVGGGSVLDGTKFIASAIRFKGKRPWDIVEKGAKVRSSVPLGGVLTLPATGSEMNGNAVISRDETRQKLGFYCVHSLPRFSILDPETTYTLSERQTGNGIVDTMVHVFEQYATLDMKSRMNIGIAEAVLRTVIENGRTVGTSPRDYVARANLMWASTLALNGLIGCGAAHDWTSHAIGHEVTAFHGLDHGQTLAVVWPNVARLRLEGKKTMLAGCARRVWGLSESDDGKAAVGAIESAIDFWNSVGVKTRLRDYGVGDERFGEIAERLCGSGGKLGENGDIGKEEVLEILRMSL